MTAPDVAGLVETAARALYEHAKSAAYREQWDRLPSDIREAWRVRARAVLAAVLPKIADIAPDALRRIAEKQGCQHRDEWGVSVADVDPLVDEVGAWLRSLAEGLGQ